ncbi:MAG: dephospho-CoA kinase [Bacilli bacterium]|jgi:dephospho-CoA kinase|nr:dephospho-CoA kinase [Bacilli bacterium]
MSTLSRKIIGLTGNIASGKSSISDYLKGKGYAIVDTDIITQNIYQNNDVFKNELVNLLGNNILVNNKIDKNKVSKLVFENKDLLIKLNNIIHPIIKELSIKELNKYQGIVFFIVPLLFETDFNKLVDKIILVTINKDIQIDRLMKRNNLTYEATLQRINSQVPQEDKIKKADYIIDNSKDLNYLYDQINKILKKIEDKDEL